MNRQTCFFFLALLMIGPLLASCGPQAQATPTLVSTQAPIQTATSTTPPYAPVTMTASANLAATATAFANFYHPEQITADMVGQTVCMRGVIKNFVQTPRVRERVIRSVTNPILSSYMISIMKLLIPIQERRLLPALVLKSTPQ